MRRLLTLRTRLVRSGRRSRLLLGRHWINMSIFFRNLSPKQIGNAYRFISTAQTKCTYWYPDLKPGPYPRTKEEREAAAKKYNLLPEEYEPYSEDDDVALGDYPKLPFESVDSKDPWYNWDHEELRRNYNDPIPFRMINLLPEALSTGPLDISHEKGTLIFVGLVLSTLGIAYLLRQVKIITPIMEEQLVTPGVKHYTFNLEKGSKKHKKKTSPHDKEKDKHHHGEDHHHHHDKEKDKHHHGKEKDKHHHGEDHHHHEGK